MEWVMLSGKDTFYFQNYKIISIWFSPVVTDNKDLVAGVSSWSTSDLHAVGHWTKQIVSLFLRDSLPGFLDRLVKLWFILCATIGFRDLLFKNLLNWLWIGWKGMKLMLLHRRASYVCHVVSGRVLFLIKSLIWGWLSSSRPSPVGALCEYCVSTP